MNAKEISQYIQYLKLRPTFGYYKVFTSRFLSKILRSMGFNKDKFLPSGVMIIKFKGIKGIVRPNHEDLLYYSGAAKLKFTERWFKPQFGENVIDVGSNVGRYSLIASKRGANVIAIEANSHTFEVLSDNCKINGFENIRPMNVVVSNNSGKLTLYYTDGLDGIATVDKKWIELNAHLKPTAENEVQSEKLDNLHLFNSVDWLLIDVEGHEIQVLEGATKTLSVTKRIIIEVERVDKNKVLKILDGFVPIKEEVGSELSNYLFLVRREDYNKDD